MCIALVGESDCRFPESTSHRRVYACVGTGSRMPLISAQANGGSVPARSSPRSTRHTCADRERRGATRRTRARVSDAVERRARARAAAHARRGTSCTVAVLPVPGTPET